MPLKKPGSNGATVIASLVQPTATENAQAALAAAQETSAAALKAAPKQKAPAASKATDKESYWENKEARDIETGKRIRRSGVWQAALQSMAGLQFNQGGTLESYLELVDKIAEHGLNWVSKD